jgi:hypothetical protein
MWATWCLRKLFDRNGERTLKCVIFINTSHLYIALLSCKNVDTLCGWESAKHYAQLFICFPYEMSNVQPELAGLENR